MKKVLITRQIEQAQELINILSYRGHLPFIMPLIETKPVPYFAKCNTVDIIIFSSENAVKYYQPYATDLTAKRYIAVGEKTASTFKSLIKQDISTPKSFDIKSVVEELSSTDIDGKTILILSAKDHTEADISTIISKGATVEYVGLYETVGVIYDDSLLDNFIFKNQIDVITFCSPSAVRSFMLQSKLSLNDYQIIAIGKTTADYLQKNNIKSEYPTKYTLESMVDII